MFFLATQRHSPEACPKYHEPSKTGVQEAWRRRDSHMPVGVRLTAAYAEPLNHQWFLIFEAANVESVEQAIDNLGLARWGSVEIRRVDPVDDLLKKM